MRKVLLPLILCFALGTSSKAQQFGSQRVIDSSASGAISVCSADLDLDGDEDVIAAHFDGRRVVWYENLGSGSFGTGSTVTDQVPGVYSVAAADIDSDGDLDLLSASENNDLIAWYENLGGGVFGAQNVITINADFARCVFGADIDNDGDIDVLSASYGDDKIAWYENDGFGAFGPQRIISTSEDGPNCVTAADLDGDGDSDVLSASVLDDKITWYENLGGQFGPAQVLTTSADQARWVDAVDLDRDGDLDVVSASWGDGKIAWYENVGGGTFGTQRVITGSAPRVHCIVPTDLDFDGYSDLVSAEHLNNTVGHYRNLGNGNFSSRSDVTTNALNVFSVHVADLDLDGDLDVLSASEADNKIAWYENLLDPDADQDGLSDPLEVLAGTNPLDQDSDDDGLSDGEEFNTARPDTRWLQGPNGNYYRLAPATTWSQASSAARAQGHELTSVQDQAEATWLADTYGAVSGGFWIGLSDFLGTYTWSDGDSSAYRRWAAGEPNGANSPAGVFVGGPNAAEPGYWYTDAFGTGPYLAVWEALGPDTPMTATDPLNWDTDGDGLADGQEDGLDQVVWDGDLDGDGIPDVGGTDLAFFVPDTDPGTTTDPLNLDTDNDGLADGEEDLDGDGATNAVETDPSNFDTDGDQLPDGLELGLTAGTLDTDGSVFTADTDPLTTTNPTLSDTDTGGVGDGIEDQNRDGGVDTWETDPNNPNDEALGVYFSGIVPGGRVHIEVWNATPMETIIPAYSLAGPGPSPTGLGINVDLTRPIVLMDPFLSDALGRGSVDRLPVPASAPLGLPVWMQAVEVPISGNFQPRASNPVLIPIGAN